MRDLSKVGGVVCGGLRDDVWQIGEPGTLCLTPSQVQHLRTHLNQLVDALDMVEDPEDG